MWPLTPRRQTEDPPCPGEPEALDGLAAAFAVETMAGTARVVHPDLALAELGGDDGDLLRTEPDRLPGLLAGLVAGGLRGAGFISEPGVSAAALGALAGKRLAAVVHLCARAAPHQAVALGGGHDDYYAAADQGLFQLFAANVQEAADFTLIAHRVAELSLTPGVCAQDYYATGQSVQHLMLPQRDLIERFLGHPGDLIATPTPAQRTLFGERRPRVPRLIDVDQPAGLGGVRDGDSYLRSVAAQRPYFAAHLSPLLDQALAEFSALAGRRYEPLAAYRCGDAAYLVLAMGAVVEPLAAVADHLRARRGIKVGVLNLSVLRPFPGARLSHWLKSRQALTVLESADVPLAGEAPLAREVRAAIDRAAENGAAGRGATPWPEFARYRRSSDRPRMFTGSYGIGTGLPSFTDLCAVVENMLPGGAGRRQFYVGVDFADGHRRFPQLQVLEHRLRQDYPELETLSLPRAKPTETAFAGRAIELEASKLQGALFAGNLFARALAGALGGRVRTFPEGGLEPDLRRGRFVLAHGDEDCRCRPSTATTLLVAGEALLAALEPKRAAREGAVVAASERDVESLWRGLSRPTAAWIRERKIRLLVVPARAIAEAGTAPAGFVDQLELWALFGAALGADALPAAAVESVGERLKELLATHFAANDPLVGQIVTCVRRGAEQVREVPWQRRPEPDRGPVEEPPPPWTVPAHDAGAAPLFDRARFWHSVGFLHERGAPADALIDPFLASAVLPAGSSAQRDMTPFRRRLPQWLPENCTGCGQCWALCPDSALPPSVHPLGKIIDTALAGARARGAAMTQMTRIVGHLSKQAQRIVSRDGLGQYRAAGPLLSEAFGQLLDRMSVDDETRSALEADFEMLRAPLADWPLARTEAFFEAPEKAAKGSGSLLSIGLNTLSCKACGVCVEACPEDAFAWTEQTDAALDAARRNRAFQATLPEPVLEPFLRHGEAASEVNRLLSGGVYRSMVGGDGAAPGDGCKTAVRLLVAAVESVMRGRFGTHAARLAELIAALRSRIQGEVQEVVKINDFEDFAERLGRLKGAERDADELAELLVEGRIPRRLDADRLARLTGLLNELEAQQGRYAGGEARRAALVLALDRGAVLRWSGTYPDNPHANPWISHESGGAAALAKGLFEGMARRLAAEMAACRLAAAELKDRCSPADHKALRDSLCWEDLEPDERALLPVLLVIGQPKTTPWADLAGLLAGPEPICVALLDADGIEVPSAVAGSPALLALGAGNAFVQQSSVGHPGHLIEGVIEALETSRPALFQVYAPDPQAAGAPPEKMAELAERAYRSRAVPLFRFDPARTDARLSLAGNPEPEAPWAEHTLEHHEPDGDHELRVPLTVADWALGQARFRGHFEIVARGHLNDRMRPLAEFLTLDATERDGVTPFVHVTDEQRRLFVARVSGPMAQAAETCQRIWAALRQRSGATSRVGATVPAPPAPAAATPAPAATADTHRELSESLLQLCGLEDDPDFFQRSLRSFLEEREPAPEVSSAGAARETPPDESSP